MWAYLLIVPGLVIWWFAILNFVGFFSGWWRVAKHYKFQDSHFDGTWFRSYTAKVGWANYNNMLHFGVNAEGLCIRVAVLFRPGHPPIFIPWTDIEIAPYKGWVFRYVELTFAKTPTVRFRFDQKLGEMIAKSANQSWEILQSPPTQ